MKKINSRAIYKFLFLLTGTLALIGCTNNTEHETTVQQQYERTTELEEQPEKQSLLNATFVTTQQIHESMPEFTFYRIIGNRQGNSDVNYDVSIRIENDGQVIQEIDGLFQELGGPSGIETFSDPQYEIRFLDLTDNGYLDMTMHKTWGGTLRNEPHYFWLWDREAGKFVKNETLMHLSWGGMVTLNNHDEQGHI